MTGIISDIHGNFPALVSVINELEKYECDQIISLGDVAGYYGMINECIELLRQKGIINLMGNHDYYICYNRSCGRSTTANLCLDFQRKIITKENLSWLSRSPQEYRDGRIWAVHGGWNDYLDEYISDYSFLEEISNEEDIFISGHTHIQKIVKGKNAVYVNPGSVGQPRDNNSDAAFAIIDSNDIKLCRASYDIDIIRDYMNAHGFDARVTSCLYKGVKIGDD